MITALGSRETRGNTQVSNIRSAPAACQLVGQATKAERSTVWVSGVPVGPGTVTVIAGPCAVESPKQTVRAARMAQAAGASLLRGGAFKPRTSPYAFQGLGEDGLKILTATRSTLDIAAVPLAQRQSHLPVIVDPSHSCGQRELVIPLTRAAIAAGADGVIIDVHPDPYDALCDGRQALVTEDLVELSESVKRLAAATGRAVTRQPGTPVATALRSG